MSEYVDLSTWPVATVNWRPGYTDRDLDEAIALLTTCLQRGEPFCILADFTQIPPMSKAQQQKFMDFTNHRRDLLRLHLRGLGFAMTSSVMRLAINGFNLVARTPAPVRAFSSMSEARVWALGQLSGSAAKAAV